MALKHKLAIPTSCFPVILPHLSIFRGRRAHQCSATREISKSGANLREILPLNGMGNLVCHPELGFAGFRVTGGTGLFHSQ
jgi:hypothetical protein